MQRKGISPDISALKLADNLAKAIIISFFVDEIGGF